MTKNPANPQAVDAQRKAYQHNAKRSLCLAMTRKESTAECMEKHWDNLVDVTEMRVRARLSGWLPLKGE